MPDEPTAAPAAPDTPTAPELVPLDRRTAAFELQRAFSRKGYGHARAELDRTVNSLVAEIVAEALADAGIVLAQPKYPEPVVSTWKPNPHLME